ncbi:ribosome biogenesis protein WDR12 homolog [Galendromus occidentalis]|uniref:Ribosome biogenesis protein WDR12 homolog n=1 Tax=Galendromus occidentalis TaxID=34638 RepID=A0AAJ6QY45_9ACAR|nr:ribosome biogenesis protein WDR12 homolog [Galendromus occidentalis]
MESDSLQARFFTKEEEFSLPEDPVSLELDVTPEQLSLLINELLGRQGDTSVDFGFLIRDNIVHSTLREHLQEHEISAETLVEIEYIEKCPSPEPVDSLLHEDWVSGIHCATVGSRQLILSGSYDSSVTVWSVSGKKLISLSGHAGPVKAVRWVHSDERYASFVSTSHDETAKLWLWDHQKNQIESVITCKGHQRSVDCVDVDLSNNRFATAGFDNVVKIWSTSTEATELDLKKDSEPKKSKLEQRLLTRTPLVSLANHTEAVTGLRFTTPSEMITCAMDCTMKVWDIAVGGFTNNLLGSKPFLDLSYSALNNLVLSANADRHVRLWDTRSKEGSVVKSNFTSHTGWVSSVCWSPSIENQFISASYDNILKLWDLRSAKAPLYDMEGHEDKILCCDWSLEELMVSGAADNKLKIFRHANPTSKSKPLGSS